jgi:hypothetical protein
MLSEPGNDTAMQPSRGILYVATRRDQYLEEAFLSAESIKQRFPSISITLFTDRPQHAVCNLGCFDSVRCVEAMSQFAVNWSDGQFDRICALLLTPYDRTLNLDTDTLVLTNELPNLFELLSDNDVGMAETSVDDSYSRQYSGRRMFNVGVILYRKNEKTWDLLKAWAALAKRNFQSVNALVLPPIAALEHIKDEVLKRRLLCIDQTALVELLSPEVNRFELAVKILDYSWNHRGSRLPENNREPVRIRHLPRHLAADTHARNLEAAIKRISQPKAPLKSALSA